jgi:hypothetical protein
MFWINLDQDKYRWSALVSMKTNIQIPQKAGNFWVNWVSIRFSRALLHAVSSDTCLLIAAADIGLWM